MGWLDECSKEIKKNAEIFIGDIRDPQSVKTLFLDVKKVLHLASLKIGIPYSYYSPDTYIDTNIKGTLNILNASRDNNISKIIHTSTSEVYGTAQKVPMMKHIL